jgi:pimeloyl-ACP methyl ester carboxylesterase
MHGRARGLRRVEIDGLEIAYQRVGDGQSVVLLHGFFGDHRVWRHQLELADDWTVVAWDAPGCGASTQPPPTFTIADYADTLATFIGALGLDRPHLVGNSFGGALALELAVRHPSIPASLVVNGGSAGWSGSFPPEVVAERLRHSLEALDLPAEEVVSRWVPQFVTASASESVVSELGAIIADVRPDGMRVMMRAYAEADLRPELAHITAPTLLIWGEEDVRAPLPVAEDLREMIAGSTLTVIPWAGHLTAVEAPQRFNAEVRAFIGSIDAAASVVRSQDPG